MFKKGDEVENNYTLERRKIVAVEEVPIRKSHIVTVYVLDDGEQWEAAQLIKYWSKV